MSQTIQTADLDWQSVDGIEIPVSKLFGDVYFSKANGLLETRHVFINGNDLNSRLANLSPFENFNVGETGFGTGLNILTLWQTWQNVRADNHSQLHVISVEKFPLRKSDLIRALNAWPELAPLAQQLIDQYPYPIAGCHRLSFPKERFSIDLWLGDAHDIFPVIPKTTDIHAWFLDGFAPSCNPDMWEENVLKHIIRLSGQGTTYASFSVAGVLKRGLKQYGVTITRPKGFGHKREMLKGLLNLSEENSENLLASSVAQSTKSSPSKQRQIAIIGAGIAGLSCAYALALRGHRVQIFDQTAPLNGASGNPLALLNPKLCPIEQSSTHLMTLSWQHALKHYKNFRAFQPIAVHQIPLKNAEELLSLADQYPPEMLAIEQANQLNSKVSVDHLKLNTAGCIQPKILADEILQHELISFQQAKIVEWQKMPNQQIMIIDDQQQHFKFDQVIICSGRESAHFFSEFPVLKPIRGQVSWFKLNDYPSNTNEAYCYGGYCAPLNQNQLILGASFHPNRDDVEVSIEDHQHNLNLFEQVFSAEAKHLPELSTWQGRASIRAQSLDYFPLLGRVEHDAEVYTFSGLGSKGFLFAPLCTEVLIAQMLQLTCPIPQSLLDKLQVQRFKKKIKAQKPYFNATQQSM